MNEIIRKNLWCQLGNVKQKDWLKAGVKLGLFVSSKLGKGSHAVIRDPNNPNINDINGLISTVQKKLYKEANQTIFKHLMAFGIKEDDIWKALKKLS
ncbi:hypothetical protein KKA24_02925 [Patescibacteria group bacterium]|nr:hypothetical protein [Patescibacteria group bacterium]